MAWIRLSSLLPSFPVFGLGFPSQVWAVFRPLHELEQLLTQGVGVLLVLARGLAYLPGETRPSREEV